MTVSDVLYVILDPIPLFEDTATQREPATCSSVQSAKFKVH